MRLIRSRKFLYLVKPKTASTSIRAALDEHAPEVIRWDNGEECYHPNLSHVRGWLENRQDDLTLEDLTIATSIRNPWSLMVSFFRHFQPDLSLRYSFDKNHDPDRLTTFHEWLVAMEGDPLHHNSPAFTSLDRFARDGEVEASFIMRSENLRDELSRLSRLIALPFSQSEYVENVRAGGSHDYRRFFTTRTKNFVGDVFRADVIAGNYSF